MHPRRSVSPPHFRHHSVPCGLMSCLSDRRRARRLEVASLPRSLLLRVSGLSGAARVLVVNQEHSSAAPAVAGHITGCVPPAAAPLQQHLHAVRCPTQACGHALRLVKRRSVMLASTAPRLPIKRCHGQLHATAANPKDLRRCAQVTPCDVLCWESREFAGPDGRVLHLMNRNGGDVELAPWLMSGDNRVVVVHISSKCETAALQCATIRTRLEFSLLRSMYDHHVHRTCCDHYMTVWSRLPWSEPTCAQTLLALPSRVDLHCEENAAGAAAAEAEDAQPLLPLAPTSRLTSAISS